MKIPQKLYNLMLSNHKASLKHRNNTKKIDIEMKKLGLNVDKITDHDMPIVDFTDYGVYHTKEELEEKLEDYLNSEESEQ